MKKILTIAVLVLLSQGIVVAQKAKTVQKESVPERYVKDFTNKASNAKDVCWTLVDTMVYDATFVNENGNKQAFRFSPKGTETRWYIESKWYPKAITDTVSHNYPKHKIRELYVLSIKNKTTYQVRIAKKACCFSKKEKDAKLLNFETDGKLIDIIDIK